MYNQKTKAYRISTTRPPQVKKKKKNTNMGNNKRNSVQEYAWVWGYLAAFTCDTDFDFSFK